MIKLKLELTLALKLKFQGACTNNTQLTRQLTLSACSKPGTSSLQTRTIIMRHISSMITRHIQGKALALLSTNSKLNDSISKGIATTSRKEELAVVGIRLQALPPVAVSKVANGTSPKEAGGGRVHMMGPTTIAFEVMPMMAMKSHRNMDHQIWAAKCKVDRSTNAVPGLIKVVPTTITTTSLSSKSDHT